MGWSLLADATMLVHFAFLVFLVSGGFIAWRWHRALYLHIAVVAWAVVLTAFSLECPLTPLENHFRRRADEAELVPGGFIDTYIEGVIYPEEYVWHARALVAVAVLVSWVGLYVRGRWEPARRHTA